MYKIFLLEGESKSECLELLLSYIKPALQHRAYVLIINAKEKEVLHLETLPCIIKDSTIITDSRKLIYEICKLAEVDSLILKEPEVWSLTKTFYLESEQKEILKKLKDRLITNTFLFNPHITLADIFAIVPAIKVLKELPKENVMEWVSVYRWAEYILNLPYIGDLVYDKTGGLKNLESLISKEDIKETSIDKKDKREELKAKEKGKEEEKTKKEITVPPFAQLDLRVGRIINIQKLPNSTKIYTEEVDIGTETRKIASGLQEFVTIEELLNHNVVVFCNLKAKNIAGYMSHGMILCASNKDQSNVEILIPPDNSKPGDPIMVDGIDRQPIEEVNMSKHNNPWKKVEALLTTNEELIVTLDGKPLKTTTGAIKVKSLKAAYIS